MSAWQEHMDGVASEWRDALMQHLRLEGDDNEGELQMLLSTYLPAAWVHCQDFCNRTFGSSPAMIEDLVSDGYPVRAPAVADERFKMAVFLMVGWFYENREDQPNPPRMVERLLWPLRANLGV